MISPLKTDFPFDEIPVKFEPFYLYESVTSNILGEVEHLSGWQDRVKDQEEDSKFSVPASQHLCMFFKA